MKHGIEVCQRVQREERQSEIIVDERLVMAV